MLERYRKVVMGARLILIRGRIQRHEDIIHLVAEYLEDRSSWLESLLAAPNSPPGSQPEAADLPAPASLRQPRPSHPRNARVIPKSRDFH
jgi:error-prone DNA polymerase